MKEIKIKKSFIKKVFRDFEAETKCVLNATVAKWLIEYAIAKFIIESNKSKK